MGIFVDATSIKDEPEKMNVSNTRVLLDVSLVVYLSRVNLSRIHAWKCF